MPPLRSPCDEQDCVQRSETVAKAPGERETDAKGLNVAGCSLALDPECDEHVLHDVSDDGYGTVGIKVFLHVTTRKTLHLDPRDTILKAFRRFDDDVTSKISFRDLKHVAKAPGERVTDAKELKVDFGRSRHWPDLFHRCACHLEWLAKQCLSAFNIFLGDQRS